MKNSSYLFYLFIEKPSALYDETSPDWAPSVNLGYISDLPDEARCNRLQQRNLKKKVIDSVDADCDEENETGISCQTEIVELNSVSCQTDKDLAELTILQRKEYIDLKKENKVLTEEIAELKSRKVVNFTEEFLKYEDNKGLLKFYTGMYIACMYYKSMFTV